MTQPTLRLSRLGRRAAFAIVLATTFVSAYAWVGAQTAAKKPLGIEDYTRWRSISGQEISGDGKWVTYRL